VENTSFLVFHRVRVLGRGGKTSDRDVVDIIGRPTRISLTINGSTQSLGHPYQ
jgi:hypothetical protein